jgi:prepilin-type N-terminal cleavage/methylation domain-containing protein
MARADQGLTLVELLITTAIVGMIMLGMVSIDYALRSNEQQQTRSALVSLRTSAAMFDIVNTASQAIGDASPAAVTPRCIRYANLTTDNSNYICINRDLNATPTPGDYSDDTWTCYTREATDLHKCGFVSANGPASCTSGSKIAGSDRVIGTVTTDVFAAPDTPILIDDNVTKDFYFQITLKNRYDPTLATYAAVVAQEFLTNPKLKMTSQVVPSGCTP